MAKAATVDDWFEQVEPGMAPVANALRAAIEAEGGKLATGLAWGFPCWTGNERIFSVIAHTAHCNLQLWSGARLAGRWPHRVEGTGKQLRHVKAAAADEVDAELRDIIRAAIELDRTSPERIG